MTREHFNSVAAALRSTKPHETETEADTQWRKTVSGVADALAGWNPRFDRTRFLAVAGV